MRSFFTSFVANHQVLRVIPGGGDVMAFNIDGLGQFLFDFAGDRTSRGTPLDMISDFESF